LQPPFDIARAGEGQECHLPEENDVLRGVLLDLEPKSTSSQFNLRSRQLGGLRCGSRDYRGETATISEKRAVVFGKNLFRRKAGKMQDPPEPIASAGKVMTCRRRTQTWIDPAKDYRQARFKDVRKRLNGVAVSHRWANP
jgi:hypothetical protein